MARKGTALRIAGAPGSAWVSVAGTQKGQDSQRGNDGQQIAASISARKSSSADSANARWEKIAMIGHRVHSGTYTVSLETAAAKLLQNPTFIAEVCASWRAKETEPVC